MHFTTIGTKTTMAQQHVVQHKQMHIDIQVWTSAEEVRGVVLFRMPTQQRAESSLGSFFRVPTKPLKIETWLFLKVGGFSHLKYVQKQKYAQPKVFTPSSSLDVFLGRPRRGGQPLHVMVRLPTD